jgi:SAM-dependent methyltransferase
MVRALVKERMSVGEWVPPWLRYQHEERYRLAAEFSRGKRVLDAACGNGYGSLLMREQGARAVTGVDIDTDALLQATTFHRREGASYLRASATRLPFADATFDLFVSLETIEHIDDDAAYVREARRVLHDDGTFICSTPNRAVLNPGRALTDRPFNPFHVREYTREELEPILRAQFRTIRWLGQSTFAGAYVRLLTRIGRTAPMLAVRLHQMRKLLGVPFERRARHVPRDLRGATEVLVAICTNATGMNATGTNV